MDCSNCKKRETCTKLCPDMENLLQRKPEGRLYSDRTIRRKEIPYDPNDIDVFLPMEAMRRLKGREVVSADPYDEADHTEK